MTADRLDNLQVQPISALTCDSVLGPTAHHVRLSTFGSQVKLAAQFLTLFVLRQAAFAVRSTSGSYAVEIFLLIEAVPHGKNTILYFTR